jgi:hypothetical protein
MPVFSGKVIRLARELTALGNKAEALGHALKDLALCVASDETGRVLGELDAIEATKRDKHTNGRTEKPEA